MRHHLEYRALHALRIHRKEPHRHEAHMGDGGISDQLLHILLHQRDERGVDDRDDRQGIDQRREILRRVREHRQREADESIAAHLQENGGEEDRTRGRRLDMGIGQPGVDRPHRQFHRERSEESEKQPFLQAGIEMRLEQHGNVGRAGDAPHRHDGEQHQKRAQQRVKEKLEGCIDAVLAAPDADDQEHRDEAAFEEQIEEQKIERAEHADHQRLEHQKGDHIFLHPHLDRFPGGENAERHQEGRQQHERHRHAVDAELVEDAAAEPSLLLDELERRARRIVEPPCHERQKKGRHRGHQRRPARVGLGVFVVATQRQDEDDADQRQEDHTGKNPEAEHQCTPPTRYQVISAATPMSMAKA